MPSLTIRNIPDATLSRLRTRAARGHRSLNGEILAIFEEAADTPPEGPIYIPPVPLPEKPTLHFRRTGEEREPLSEEELKRRREKLDSLYWVDDRSTEEIIADIIGSRTMGRDVEL